ncbi:MAG: uroporphyrinogen-III synthase [Chloroflexi bacterium]|nr:uroporphyrinogen-III synthase [Chloroflexota bacterium]
MAVHDLGGHTVAFLEARRAPELASLVLRHHGQPLAAPCLQEVHQPDAPALQAALDALLAPDTRLSLFLTGVGASTIFAAAELHHRLDALRTALDRQRVGVRGPKPAAALRRFDVRIDLSAPPPHTTRELIEALAEEPLAGQRVAVQLYGGAGFGGPGELRAALEARGASVVELRPYVWGRPADNAPLRNLLDALAAHQVDALLVTSGVQVDHLFAFAAEHDRADRLRADLDRIVVGAQGPVAAAALERVGIQHAVQPDHGHMGALVQAVAHALASVGVPA